MCYCTPGLRTPFCSNCQPAMYRRITELEQQRDRLLEALKDILSAMDRLMSDPDKLFRAKQDARAIIKEVEAGK